MEYQLIEPKIPFNNLNIIERVLTNRGIALADIQHYLNTTNEDILNPKLIKNIEDGVKMLIKHISNNDDIFIQIDSDCDGFTSAALLINYLHKLFPAFVENHILYRVHDGKEHGIIPSTVPASVKLVIAPDSSSNDYEEHKFLSDNGIDVLVIDHHEAEKVSEYACVINNQLCDYPTKSLSGVGMVYKFCQYIDQLLNVNYANEFLDLAALGIIADMVDLKDFETKRIITLGLESIKNPYFKAMVEKQAFSLKGEVTPFGVAFYIAPYINATIRMGDLKDKSILFESMLEYRANNLIPSTKKGCKGQEETIVEQACRNCTNVKNRQTKARDAGLEIIEELIVENNLLENKILIIKLEPEYAVEKNLTGLIANQLMAKYQRPVLLLNKVVNKQTKTITWEGSARGYDKSALKDFRQFCNDSNLAMYAEGHASAFGFGIYNEDFEKFIKYSNTVLKDFDFSPCYRVDFIYQIDDMNPKDILDIAGLKSIWGQGVEEPLIAIENIKISKDNITLMAADRNPTLKITLPNGISLIKFKSSQEEYESLKSDLGFISINIVGKCERNVWNGSINPQIIVEDYEISAKQKYYF